MIDSEASDSLRVTWVALSGGKNPECDECEVHVYTEGFPYSQVGFKKTEGKPHYW